MALYLDVAVNGRVFSSFQDAMGIVERHVADAPERAFPIVKREMLMTLQRVAKTLGEQHANPWNGKVVNPTNRLQRRSGKGLQSIWDSIKVSGTDLGSLAGVISAGKLSFHEHGGTIRAKRAKYLTIPLPAAMDSRGVPLKARARDWPDTFVKRSRKGNLIIFQKRGHDIIPLYLLKPSVYIPPRLRMQETVESVIPYFLERTIDAIAEEFI